MKKDKPVIEKINVKEGKFFGHQNLVARTDILV